MGTQIHREAQLKQRLVEFIQADPQLAGVRHCPQELFALEACFDHVPASISRMLRLTPVPGTYRAAVQRMRSMQQLLTLAEEHAGDLLAVGALPGELLALRDVGLPIPPASEQVVSAAVGSDGRTSYKAVVEKILELQSKAAAESNPTA